MDAGVSHAHSEAGRAVFLTALTIEGMNPFFIVCVSCLPSCTKRSASLRSQYPMVTLSSITNASIGPTQNYVGRLWSAGSPSCSALLTRTGFWGGSGFTWTVWPSETWVLLSGYVYEAPQMLWIDLLNILCTICWIKQHASCIFLLSKSCSCLLQSYLLW